MRLTDAQLTALRHKYQVPAPPAECRVCGSPMKREPGTRSWHCASDAASPYLHPLLGRAGHAAHRHYINSTWTLPERADQQVIDLIDETEIRRAQDD